ncbi:DNA polymerase III subunit chi [Desulfuromonas thiophila]|uniref:DNA polymerase III, chi subunit n=1 Tax=Desulfuromonas thiophila TaxID=57664 RepID=A0A1G7C1T7_9BACT|nr:DNA polymerase III subunit chi [Desulfuromonas thiophila]MDD3802645.1 DNA polymerase III subunit chi [Desulfuromonas thiophila]MDY0398580.1 DNA polymerase III subunit chi [Desulfuromonas thiophila]SDE33292.1 DNA polymerase III, chi subunit [Desulfuromonas thiophila]
MGTPQVEFIRLQKPEKARYLCQLAEELLQQRQRVLMLVEDDEQALALDRFLWTWNKGSFLPHAWDNGAVECHDEPICICSQPRNGNGARVLLAAAPAPLAFSRTFSRVIDFAETYDPQRLQAARERFARWRELGCAPRMRE